MLTFGATCPRTDSSRITRFSSSCTYLLHAKADIEVVHNERGKFKVRVVCLLSAERCSISGLYPGAMGGGLCALPADRLESVTLDFLTSDDEVVRDE